MSGNGADLTTRYLGLELRNPLVASASPLTGELGSLSELEAAGASAVVLPSLFEEQIERESLAVHALHESLADGFAEAASYLPELDSYNTGPEHYLELVAAARKRLAIPVIGSLNGTSKGGWVEHARRIEEAGASALELNIYHVATDATRSAADVEQRYVELVAAVRAAVRIPLAVKIGPYFSSLAHFAPRLASAGADGIVLFNRYLQPDIDLEKLEVRPRLVLSTSAELGLPLTWIAVLRGQIGISLAATSGVHGADGVLKLLLAGADVVCLASTLLQHGPKRLTELLAGLKRWLDEREYVSVEQLKGSLCQQNAPDRGAYERANYMRTLLEY